MAKAQTIEELNKKMWYRALKVLFGTGFLYAILNSILKCLDYTASVIHSAPAPRPVQALTTVINAPNPVYDIIVNDSSCRLEALEFWIYVLAIIALFDAARRAFYYVYFAKIIPPHESKRVSLKNRIQNGYRYVKDEILHPRVSVKQLSVVLLLSVLLATLYYLSVFYQQNNILEEDILEISDGSVFGLYHMSDEMDASGKDNHLSNNSVSFVDDGLLGEAARYDNSADYLKSISLQDFFHRPEWSLAMWVKMDSELDEPIWFLSQSHTNRPWVGESLKYIYNGGDHQLHLCRTRYDVASDCVVGNILLGTTKWHHIAVTYGGNEVRGYLNGVLVGAVSSTGRGIAGLDHGFVIGNQAETPPKTAIRGLIDEVVVVGKVLKPLTIEKLYNNGRGIEVCVERGCGLRASRASTTPVQSPIPTKRSTESSENFTVTIRDMEDSFSIAIAGRESGENFAQVGSNTLAEYGVFATTVLDTRWEGDTFIAVIDNEEYPLLKVDVSDWGAVLFNSSTNESINVSVPKFETHASAVLPAIGWVRTLGSNKLDSANDVVIGSDGVLFVGGDFNRQGLSGDLSLAKYDSAGNKIFLRTFDIGSRELFQEGVISPDAMYFTGATNVGTNRDSGILLKFDTDGNPQWSRVWDTGHYEFFDEIALDNEGNIIVLGTFVGSSGSGTSFLKFDKDGELSISKILNVGSGIDGSRGLITNDGVNFYFTSKPRSGQDRIYLFKIDAEGNPIWIKKWQALAYSNVAATAFDQYGNIYVAAESNTSGSNRHPSDALILKYSPSGRVLWARGWDSGANERIRGITLDSFGRPVIAGYADAGDSQEGLVLSFDTSGSLLSSFTIQSDGDVSVQDIATDNTGDLVIAGYAPNAGSISIRNIAGAITVLPTSTTDVPASDRFAVGTLSSVTPTVATPASIENSGGGSSDMLLMKILN